VPAAAEAAAAAAAAVTAAAAAAVTAAAAEQQQQQREICDYNADGDRTVERDTHEKRNRRHVHDKAEQVLVRWWHQRDVGAVPLQRPVCV
jgi:hypothetical protein